jgi:hypothetical protein
MQAVRAKYASVLSYFGEDPASPPGGVGGFFTTLVEVRDLSCLFAVLLVLLVFLVLWLISLSRGSRSRSQSRALRSDTVVFSVE